ncbi:MAG: hypothetical protein JRG79_18045 [Deltaproteobacteria bacterium]|nr:hypothetical protein [Deltaproteobacteria bacterium]
MGYWGFSPYVSVAEKRAKAARKLNQLKKKNPDIKPVLIEGRMAIARSWWGKSWNQNLERYADYSNRIGRGRSYVRHGAVLDLQISSGKVESLVQGSRSKPYSVSVTIKGINKKIWREIKIACGGKLDSLQELLAGNFPKTLSEIFMKQGKGLFPSPKEIEFNCSCPDWAYMCKHVAATLYGIGARLDEEPDLFFKLRKVKMKDLITGAVEDKTRKLLKMAKKKSERVIEDADLADVFGIDMEEAAVPGKKRPKAAKKTPGTRKPLKRATPKTGAKPAVKKAKMKSTSKKAKSERRPKSPFDTVVGIVRRSRKGVSVATIREKTGFDEKQIRYFITKARKQGRIENLKRGVYGPS